MVVKSVWNSNPGVWQSCSVRNLDSGFDALLMPSIARGFIGVQDGCELSIKFDDTVDDIIVYDIETGNGESVKENFNGVLRNYYYVVDKELCARNDNHNIFLARCDCSTCVQLNTEAEQFGLSRGEICAGPINRTEKKPCQCYELSNLCKCFDVESLI